MATFEDFLNERNITLKRRYTENHPAQTVGNSARVRNAIIEALKDGKITVEEFNNIVSQHSSAPSKWTRGNKRFFKIEEDGVSLSKYGTKILNSLVTESTINEKVNVGRYQREGKLGYNDQFHGRHSLSFTLGVDLGLNPDNEFGGGDWPGFDHKSLYVNGGKKEGTVLADALSGKYTYDDLKSALAKFIGVKESNEVNEKMSNAELKKISKTKEYVEISQAIRAGQSDYEDMYDMIDPKMFKGLDLKKFEEILDDWFNDEGMTYDSYADFARNAYSHHVAEITKLLMPYNESVSIDEGLNKSDITYQLSIDYTGRTKPKITKLNKKRIQIKYGYKISPQKVIDSIKKVHPEVELKHVEWSDKMTGGGFHIFDILESAITEARYDKKKLLKKLGNADDAMIQTGDGKEYIIYNPDSNNADNAAMWHDNSVFAVDQDGDEYEISYKDITSVMTESVNEARVDAEKLLKSTAKGETNAVEGIKLSKEMASCFLDWLKGSTYGKKFSDLPFEKLFMASFNWGLDRYIKPGCKDEFKELKTKAKAMKESKIYTEFSQFMNESITEKSIKDWFTANIDSFKDEKEYMKAGKKAGFSKKELEAAMDDFEQGGEDYLEAHDKSLQLDESFTSKLTGIARRAKDIKDFIKMVFKHEKFKAFDTPKTQPDTYEKFLNFIKSHYAMVQQYESNKIEETMIYTNFQQFVNESLELNEVKDPYKEIKKAIKGMKGVSAEIKGDEIRVSNKAGDEFIYSMLDNDDVEEFIGSIEESLELNEALKSSKLRGLLTMKRGSKQILKAIYGFSKIELDKITDDQIMDIDPKLGKKAEGLVVYYTTQEKDNPYADTSKSVHNSANRIPANTILALGMGKDVAYIKRDYINRKMTMSLTLNPRKSSNDIGINKEYRGWDASGIYNVKRVIDVADAAFVINTSALPNAKGKIEDRVKAKEGALAFKSDKEFKDANIARYREILQKRASELPIDKLVEDAIDDATKVMKDGLKNQEKNRYGELIAGVGADGRAYKLNDISNFINGLISDYERWSGYMATIEEAEAKYGKDSKEFEWEARYSQKESEEYAKRIKDKLAKLKKRNLAW